MTIPPKSKSGQEKKKTFFIRVSSGILEHRRKMGIAIYEFLWLCDKVTWVDPVTGIGWCLRKKPIKNKQIAADLGTHIRTTDTNMDSLENFGYIVRIRTPHGHSIGIVKSKKFEQNRAKASKGDSQQSMNHSAKSDSQQSMNHQDASKESDPQNPMNHQQSDSQHSAGDPQNPMNVLDSAVDSALKETLQKQGNSNTVSAKNADARFEPTDEEAKAIPYLTARAQAYLRDNQPTGTARDAHPDLCGVLVQAALVRASPCFIDSPPGKTRRVAVCGEITRNVLAAYFQERKKNGNP